MRDLWQQLLSVTGAIATSITDIEERTILCDSTHAAENLAFMLGGQWDNCNSILLPKVDEIAIETSAKIVGTIWCYQGKSCPLLPKLSVETLKQRYAIGDRYFINANLMGADLSCLDLSQIHLCWAKLQGANLSGTNLSGADLTGTNLTEANLAQADLTGANLTGTLVSEEQLNTAKILTN